MADLREKEKEKERQESGKRAILANKNKKLANQVDTLTGECENDIEMKTQRQRDSQQEILKH